MISQFIFVNWVRPYENLGITRSHIRKAILLDVYLQVSCETDVTFKVFTALLCIRAALAPVRLHTCTGSHDPFLAADANEPAQ